MFVPYHVDVPMTRVPYANWILIGVTSVISILILLDFWPRKPITAQAPPRNALPEDEIAKELQEALAKKNQPPPLALSRYNFQPAQLFTHLFVHADLFHLLGNMFFLFCFGNAVNSKLGHLWFLTWYLVLGAIAGGLGWLLLSVGQGQYAVGASGAISGVMGLFVVFFPRNDVNVFYWFWRFVGSFTISSLWVVLFFLAADFVGTVQKGSPVAYLAHIVGTLVGIGVGIALVMFKRVESGEGEENLVEMLRGY